MLTFYFLLVIAAIGLIYQAKLPPGEAKAAALLVVLVTFIVGVLMTLAAWAILKALNRVSLTLRTYNEAVHDELAVPRLFSMTRVAILAAVGLCLFILLAIAIATGLILSA